MANIDMANVVDLPTLIAWVDPEGCTDIDAIVDATMRDCWRIQADLPFVPENVEQLARGQLQIMLRSYADQKDKKAVSWHETKLYPDRQPDGGSQLRITCAVRHQGADHDRTEAALGNSVADRGETALGNSVADPPM